MKNTKVSKIALSTLVTGGLVFGSFALDDSEAKAPNFTKGETKIELPSSALIATIKTPEKLLNDFKSEGERLQKERIEREERLRIELEKARLAEEARLAKIEAERKAKEEAERKRQEELKRQAELKRQQEARRQQAVKQQAQKQAQPSTASVSANAITMNASYYTASCTGCTGITATGVNVKNTIYYQGMRIIAVDPRVIPLYSIVEVTTPSERFHAIALDTGGAIKGNKLDILVANKQTAINLGRHNVSVKFIRKGK